MKKHKWHKEIKAWADGAEIEFLSEDGWLDAGTPEWNEDSEYRIKPKPVEPQYLYVWTTQIGIALTAYKEDVSSGFKYIGKIPLIVESNDD